MRVLGEIVATEVRDGAVPGTKAQRRAMRLRNRERNQRRHLRQQWDASYGMFPWWKNPYLPR